jgi:hypothetical protein
MTGPQLYPTWAHDDVPRNARILHLMGRVAVPAAGGAAVYVDGVTPYGGTGVLVRPRAVDSNRRERLKLLAVGVGLYDYAKRYTGNEAVLAGGTSNVSGILGIARASTWRVLTISHTAGVVAYLRAGANAFLAIPTGVPVHLENFVLQTTDVVENPSGGIAGVYYQGMLGEDAVRFDLACRVVLREVDAAGTVISAGRDLLFADGSVAPIYPEPLPRGGSPTLVPVASEGDGLFVGENRALGIQVGQTAGGLVPTSGYVVAHVVVAAFPEEIR